MKRKLDPDVFLEAAERMSDPTYRLGCCHAMISPNLSIDESLEHRIFFTNLFPFNWDDTYIPSWGAWWDSTGTRTKFQREARVLALLICYHEAKVQNKK